MARVRKGSPRECGLDRLLALDPHDGKDGGGGNMRAAFDVVKATRDHVPDCRTAPARGLNWTAVGSDPLTCLSRSRSRWCL